MTDLEYFYDYSCPYAYLASTQVERLAERAGARLVYKPFLLGGVFRSLGDAAGPMKTHAPSRARLNGLDMLRWAEHWGVPLDMPAGAPEPHRHGAPRHAGVGRRPARHARALRRVLGRVAGSVGPRRGRRRAVARGLRR